MISLKWDICFLKLAEHVSTWSKDPSTKVAAVVVDGKRRVVSIGYNGFPRGIKDDDALYQDRTTKLKYIVHGDANAILNAQASVEGCTMYIWPFSPCDNCAKLIIQSGIVRVVCPVHETPDRWKESFEASMLMLGQAGVQYNTINMEDEKYGNC